MTPDIFGSFGSSSRCSRRAFLRNFTQSRFSSGARWIQERSRTWMSHWLELMFLVDLVLLGVPGLTCSILGTNLGCQHCFARKCQVPKQSLKSQIRWRCCRPLRGLWNLSFSHGIPGHFETTFFEVGNFWGFWSFWAWVSFARSWDPQGRGWCFDTMILLSLSAWQDDCGMATGKSSEAFGVLPDHGFPLGNQTIQIIQAMEMWIFCFPYSMANFLCWRLMEFECRMNCARISKYIRILSTWKVNAFACFAASSWGERIVEVDACCVQLVFGKHDFDCWYFYLRFCKFGIYLLCQYHGEFDRIGFCHFEIWRSGCVEMMRGIGGEGFFFSILGYRRGIARVSPEIRELYCLVLPCLALFCLVPAAATAAGSAVPAAAVAAAYLPTTELRAPQGAHATVVTCRAIGVATALRAWGQRPTLALSGMRAGRCANTPARHVPVMTVCLFGLHHIASVLAPFGW